MTRTIPRLFDLSWKAKNYLLPRVSFQKYRIFRGPLAVLLQRNTPESVVDGNGHRLFLDDKDPLRLTLNNRHEPSTTAFFFDTIQKDRIVVDIGANIGYFSLLFAKLVGPKGRVFAFEPDPVNFALLAQNIRANGYTNITAERLAVSEKNGELPLFCAPPTTAIIGCTIPVTGAKSSRCRPSGWTIIFPLFKTG